MFSTVPAASVGVSFLIKPLLLPYTRLSKSLIYCLIIWHCIIT